MRSFLSQLLRSPPLTKVHALGGVALQQTQQKVPQVVRSLPGNTGNQQNQSAGAQAQEALGRSGTYSGLSASFFS